MRQWQNYVFAAYGFATEFESKLIIVWEEEIANNFDDWIVDRMTFNYISHNRLIEPNDSFGVQSNILAHWADFLSDWNGFQSNLIENQKKKVPDDLMKWSAYANGRRKKMFILINGPSLERTSGNTIEMVAIFIWNHWNVYS